jgi:hypothetical protein
VVVVICEGWSDPAIGVLLGLAGWGALHAGRDVVGLVVLSVELWLERRRVRRGGRS